MFQWIKLLGKFKSPHFLQLYPSYFGKYSGIIDVANVQKHNMVLYLNMCCLCLKCGVELMSDPGSRLISHELKGYLMDTQFGQYGIIFVRNRKRDGQGVYLKRFIGCNQMVQIFIANYVNSSQDMVVYKAICGR